MPKKTEMTGMSASISSSDPVESGPESNLSERDHADLHNTTRSTLMVGAERAQRAACNSFAANT
jgi:hypothetical protein